MLDRLFYEAWGWPHILGVRDSTTRQKENSESATEGTEGAEGAQDDRTTATGAPRIRGMRRSGQRRQVVTPNNPGLKQHGP